MYNINVYTTFNGLCAVAHNALSANCSWEAYLCDAGVMVPNNPSVSLLGPAVKYSVSELEFLPPPNVNVHNPSITTGSSLRS